MQQRISAIASYIIWLGKNTVLAAIAGMIIYFIIKSLPGYDWVCNDMLKSNMETISLYPDLTTDQKLEIKLGKSYGYLRYVKEQTPENAVILFPGAEAFSPPGQKSDYTGEPYNKLWALRFLYPRKLVIPSEMGKTSYYRKVTHIAVVNGLGAEKLETPPGIPLTDIVLPVTPVIK
ncbi:MAG TPA: hypothetical protein VM802_07500 [Chitinophaga sp.]|uniref:hypothetical protein n=1 Tax=Chitinophaga sp. TaxID=1869181 RepID=UPI002C0EE6A8|nr:hypothetical protein [Chitinophaga sp.]HVI44697.1 hypothetical protein [Chitinophaga sp.]